MPNAKTLAYAFLFLGLVGGVMYLVPGHLRTTNNDAVATVGQASAVQDILDKRNNFKNGVYGHDVEKLVSILIVPGHDDEYWGAQHRGMKEVELNRALAQNLYDYLIEEEGINVVLASGASGYNELFEAYFQREREEIREFMERMREQFETKKRQGLLEVEEDNFHNPAPGDMTLRLYGINRWVNEADFDLVVHVHFNDHANRGTKKVGKYTGFSIYAPGNQFENHGLSILLADSIYEEMKKIRPVSDLPAEESGVIETHDLIALGSNESLNAGSVLVEYGYVYESIFTDPSLRKASLDYAAYATYAGIKNLLGETPVRKESKVVKTTKNKTTAANLEWQFQNAIYGAYPPAGSTLRDCPLNGFFGECSARVR